MFQWSDGRSYKGRVKNNIINGEGIYRWPDGRRY